MLRRLYHLRYHERNSPAAHPVEVQVEEHAPRCLHEVHRARAAQWFSNQTCPK